MNELIQLLTDEWNHDVNWLKRKHRQMEYWFRKNSYDYSKSLPRNYIIPEPMYNKVMTCFRFLFVGGLLLWAIF